MSGPGSDGPRGGGPLQGIKVLDLTRFQNGPSATVRLSDYGATVIKVEHPVTGDEIGALVKLGDGYDMSREYYTRGKKSLTLNLSDPKAKPVFKKLIEWCDVLTENFKPGTLDNYGYTYEQCKEWNPGIIYCVNSGFGDRGPMGKSGSFDGVAQAFSGVMHSQGGGPSYAPQNVDFAFSDEIGAMNFTQGILMAYIAKMKNGKGQKLTTSQVGATVQFQQNGLAQVFHINGKQRDTGAVGAPKWIANKYQASDKKWFLIQPVDFMKTCDMIGLSALKEDARCKTVRDRTKNQDFIEQEYQKVFATQSREHWLKVMGDGGQPAGPIHTYKEVMEHEQMWANGYLVKTNFDDVPGSKPEGEVQIGKVLQFSETPAGPVERGAQIGEHNNEVLKDIVGLSADEVKALEAAKVIRADADVKRKSKM